MRHPGCGQGISRFFRPGFFGEDLQVFARLPFQKYPTTVAANRSSFRTLAPAQEERYGKELQVAVAQA